MREILYEIPEFVRYLLGLILTGIGGWFAHRVTRKKTSVETDGIVLENSAKIRKLREEEIKQILDRIDGLERELEEYKKSDQIKNEILEQKERELQEAKAELADARRQVTKLLLQITQLKIK